MKKMINATRIEGVLYQHKLELKVSGPQSKKPNTEFISGTIDVATDNKMTNILQVHYTYVTATTNAGKENPTFKTLKGIIDGTIGCYTNPAVKENAAKVRIDSTIGLNEFYSNRSGTEELISVKRNEGGFIHVTPSITENESQRNTFEVDIVITRAFEKEEVVDSNGNVTAPAKVIIDGRIFDFRKNMLPVQFSVLNKQAQRYFLDLDPSMQNPVFTKVKGIMVSQQITRYITEASAFGEDSVREVQSSNKDYIVTWAARDPYEFDTEGTITREELQACGQARENALAEMKQRADDWRAQQGNAFAPTATAAVANNDDPYRF
jgi:hypothetical protein